MNADIKNAIDYQIRYSNKHFGSKFNSYHEGYSVILEELDEVWHEIKQKSVDKVKLKNELIQVASMAVKLLQQIE